MHTCEFVPFQQKVADEMAFICITCGLLTMHLSQASHNTALHTAAQQHWCRTLLHIICHQMHPGCHACNNWMSQGQCMSKASSFQLHWQCTMFFVTKRDNLLLFDTDVKQARSVYIYISGIIINDIAYIQFFPPTILTPWNIEEACAQRLAFYVCHTCFMQPLQHSMCCTCVWCLLWASAVLTQLLYACLLQ